MMNILKWLSLFNLDKVICITAALLFHGTSLIILHGLLHVCVWLEGKTGRGNDGILGSRKRKTNWEKEAVSFLL